LTPPSKKKSKLPVVLGVVFALILVVGGGVAIAVFKPHEMLRGSKPDTTEPSPVEEVVEEDAAPVESVFEGFLDDVEDDLDAIDEDVDMDVGIADDLDL
jgi:flagellar basal body-associated protein FliL